MIFVDESTVKVGGVVLPGLFKSMEIKGEAKVEEQEVEGKTTKPKQATGYEDIKITLELILLDGPKLTKHQKLTAIQKLFQKPGQSKPVVLPIVNEHTAIRGVTKVVFKSLVTREQNNKTELGVTIELWEYYGISIKAQKGKKKAKKKGGSSSGKGNINLNADYQQYLEGGQRGKAPTQQNKTSKTTATDTRETVEMQRKMRQIPM